MEKKKMAIVMSMMFLIISATMDTVTSQGFDCYDSCITACVNPDPRLMSRCERKCGIRCGPAMAAGETNGH